MAGRHKGTPKTGGRQKGTPNKTSALLKDAILKAATEAGDGDLAAYLTVQAKINPGPFMTLLGKVLPMQVTGEDGGPFRLNAVQRTIVSPANPDS
jgi:hypothetical protein